MAGVAWVVWVDARQVAVASFGVLINCTGTIPQGCVLWLQLQWMSLAGDELLSVTCDRRCSCVISLSGPVLVLVYIQYWHLYAVTVALVLVLRATDA